MDVHKYSTWSSQKMLEWFITLPHFAGIEETQMVLATNA